MTDYRSAGRTFDDLVALDTLDKLAEEERRGIAQMALEISNKTEIDPIDACTLLMKMGQYMSTHAGVKK